jgi:hypothetical protein
MPHLIVTPNPLPNPVQVGELEWVSWHDLFDPVTVADLRLSSFCATVTQQVTHPPPDLG